MSWHTHGAVLGTAAPVADGGSPVPGLAAVLAVDPVAFGCHDHEEAEGAEYHAQEESLGSLAFRDPEH